MCDVKVSEPITINSQHIMQELALDLYDHDGWTNTGNDVREHMFTNSPFLIYKNGGVLPEKIIVDDGSEAAFEVQLMYHF